MCGCCPRFTMIHPCGDSLTARLLHQYGRPNLLPDPTHLFPHSKNTTSLPDMMLSHGFLWRCLKGTVPAMTLSRRTEALQLQGPSWVFLNEGQGVGGCRSASFSFIHSITFAHRPHTPLCTQHRNWDDYYWVLVTLQLCRVSIRQTEDLPPPGKTHLDLIWGKICLPREREGG